MTLAYFLIIAALIVIPFWRLLPRYGIHRYFSLLAAFPAVALILLWIIAFKDRVDGQGA
ncbi:MAG: hypothetical protein AAF762_06675 [Pseudomonadota bacterium]